MKMKLVMWPLTAAVATTGVLYVIGHVFGISNLRWYYEQTIYANGGFEVEYGGSIIPVIIGIGAGFGTGRLLNRRIVT